MIPIRPGFSGGQPIGGPVRFGGQVGPMGGGGMRPQMPGQRPIASMKKGGKVKKTGLYKLHKGETVKKAKAKGKKSDTSAFVAGKRA